MTLPPAIVLRVPGPWETAGDLGKALAYKTGTFFLSQSVIVNLSTKQPFPVLLYDHDPSLPRAFSMANRGSLTPEDLVVVGDHKQVAYLRGPGGSIEAARGMMKAAAALLRAGGLGVKVESAGLAHSSIRYRSLASDGSPEAIYQGYVTLVRRAQGTYFSCGMHNLGLPDVYVSAPIRGKLAGPLLHTFLRHSLHEKPVLDITHAFSIDGQPPYFRVSHEVCGLYPTGDLFYNPYGMYVLTAI